MPNDPGSGTLVQSAPIMLDDAGLTGLVDPQPLLGSRQRWTRLAGPLVSLLTLAAVLYQFRDVDLQRIAALVPLRPGFWLAFGLYYLASPVSEWIIFRRLWSLPASGICALMRKQVSNEILLGYLGEVYFYAWARQNAQLSAAPFGAIKDIAILSALTGNVVTLVMLAVAAPLLGWFPLGTEGGAFAWSIAFILVTSLVATLFRRTLFTLRRSELRMIAIAHLARIVAMTLLAAAMWHLILPGVPLGWWLLLATLRLLVSRLPFLPNKDLVFAGLATFLVGHDTDIAAAMALMASLILAAHLIVGAALGASELAGEGGKR